ncbi:MAG: hypothetical protein M3119_08635 [Verrucomicrobiota bacterium]|nr:hypothetical protein [Verrucomicrobiota bacterium]MDQ6940205.1 hypothetical protein [Verrucomicrobiota bacterium]
MKKICALLAVALLWLGYRQWTAPITHSPGVLIANDPEQIDLSVPMKSSMAHFI